MENLFLISIKIISFGKKICDFFMGIKQRICSCNKKIFKNLKNDKFWERDINSEIKKMENKEDKEKKEKEIRKY